jgi:hypothetical protein
MNVSNAIAHDRDTRLETLVAKLTEAAYPVALRHGVQGSWVDLELDLWKALGDTLKKVRNQESGLKRRPSNP